MFAEACTKPFAAAQASDSIASQYRKQTTHTKPPALKRKPQRATWTLASVEPQHATKLVAVGKQAAPTLAQSIGLDRKRLMYHSQEVDANLNGSTVIGANSSAIENDRQLSKVDMRVAAGTAMLTSLPLHKSILNSISQLLGLQSAGVHPLGSHTPTAGYAKQREMMVRLSMNDPLFSETHRTAHCLYVSGKPVTELRAGGVTASHLMEIGVTYDDWAHTCDLGVQDLVLLNAEWLVLLQMGFQPKHITDDRTKAGPNVLAQPPLSVTFDTLEQTLGLTVDEAIFSLAFTTADFSVLGESLTSLMKRGLNSAHVAYMQEPAFNFEKALAASPDAINRLFGPEVSQSSPQVPDRTPLTITTPKVKAIHPKKQKPFSVI